MNELWVRVCIELRRKELNGGIWPKGYPTKLFQEARIDQDIPEVDLHREYLVIKSIAEDKAVSYVAINLGADYELS